MKSGEDQVDINANSKKRGQEIIITFIQIASCASDRCLQRVRANTMGLMCAMHEWRIRVGGSTTPRTCAQNPVILIMWLRQVQVNDDREQHLSCYV